MLSNLLTSLILFGAEGGGATASRIDGCGLEKAVSVLE